MKRSDLKEACNKRSKQLTNFGRKSKEWTNLTGRRLAGLFETRSFGSKKRTQPRTEVENPVWTELCQSSLNLNPSICRLTRTNLELLTRQSCITLVTWTNTLRVNTYHEVLSVDEEKQNHHATWLQRPDVVPPLENPKELCAWSKILRFTTPRKRCITIFLNRRGKLCWTKRLTRRVQYRRCRARM